MRAPDRRYHPKLREQLACYTYTDPLSQNLETYVAILNRSIAELLSWRAVLADGVVPRTGSQLPHFSSKIWRLLRLNC
jgi:hypothetical protein